MQSKIEKFFKSDFSVATFIYSVFFILWCRVDLFFGVWQTSDETGYINRIDRILKSFFPVHESIYDRVENFYAPGAPIAWLPGATLSRIISQFLPGNDWHWHWAFTSIVSSLFFIPLYILALKVCEELDLIPKKRMSEARDWNSCWLVLLIVSCTQIMHYAFHRVLMSHVVELTVVLATVYALIKNRFTLAACSSAYLCITRYNDAPVFLLIFGRYLDVKNIKVSTGFIVDFIRKNIVLSVFILAVSIWVFRVGFVTGYSKFTLSEVLIGLSTWDVFYFFLAPDWGVIWLLPFWMTGFFFGLIHFKKLSWMSRAGIIWWLFETLICVLWRGNGSDMGQRYLIGSTIGILLVWADCIRIYGDSIRKKFRILSGVNAVWILILSTVFYTVDATYSDNEFYMPFAVSTLFTKAFYLTLFERSGIGVLFYSFRDGMAPLYPILKGPVTAVKEEGLYVFYAMFGVQLTILFASLVGFRYRKLGTGP